MLCLSLALVVVTSAAVTISGQRATLIFPNQEPMGLETNAPSIGIELTSRHAVKKSKNSARPPL